MSVFSRVRRKLRPTALDAHDVPPADFEPAFLSILERCRPYTMTSAERMYALYKAVEYLTACRIDGALVECGVWRGGSAMVGALTLTELGETGRDIYLYDTFSGMTEPGLRDVSFKGTAALAEWRTLQHDDGSAWCDASLDDVRANMRSTGYPESLINYIEGPVEETIPGLAPDAIALLRLDTDWYESTRHELLHLYPRLVVGGVLIIDDYGHWRGAREAVDEYFGGQGGGLLLNRIDYTGRVGVKAHVE